MSSGKPRRAGTEQRIVDLLRSSAEALDTADVATRLGLHPNGVRLHLQRLETNGLVEHELVREGIGRPRDSWRVSPRAIAEADMPHTGWAMARSLARAIPATPARLKEVEAAGVEMGEELVERLGPSLASEPAAALDQALEALGFDPERTDNGEQIRYRLMTCPYAEAVRENPAVVCRLHRGVIQGVLASVAPGAALTGFEPKDPDLAGCVVEVALRQPQPSGASG